MKLQVLFTTLLCSLIKSVKIIKNVNIPACKNCIFYKPGRGDFASTMGLCEKFGEKNVVTDTIRYEYADHCRNQDESKCGKEGKLFQEEPNIQLKRLKHYLGENAVVLIFINLYFFSIYIAYSNR